VIQRDRVARAMKARKGRWLFFIDIAVPRDVDPAVGDVENVYLYDVDELEKVVAENRAGREREAHDAFQILDEELERFRAVQATLGVVPTIKLLRGRFLELAQAEAERAKVGGATKEELQRFAEALVNKLLHKPLTVLKKEAQENPDSELAETVRALFDLHTGNTEEINLNVLDDNVIPIKK
jgi:glutamyl-tRNA reductase